MAGMVTMGNHNYLGTIELDSSVKDGVENGSFVCVNFADKTAKPCTSNTQSAWFVENLNDKTDEELINKTDHDLTINAGEKLRLHKLLPDEHFQTTKAVDGDSLKEGDVVDVGTTGLITKTSGTPAQTFTIDSIETI